MQPPANPDPSNPPAPNPPAGDPPTPNPAGNNPPTPPVGTGDPPPPTPPTGDPTDGDPTSPDGWKKALAASRAEADKSRKDAAAAAKQLADAQSKIQGFEDEKKTEAERQADALAKAQSRVTELEAERNATALRYAALEEARKHGFINPEHALRLLNTTGVTFDEKGAPVGIADLVKALAEDPDNAYMLGSTTGGNGNGNAKGVPPTPSPGRTPGADTPELIEKRRAEFARDELSKL